MGCCGQGRTFANRAPARQAVRRVAAPSPDRVVASPDRVAPPPASAVSASGPVAPLRYVRPGGIIVRGPVTGRQYSFTAAQPVQPVAAQDAAGLLRTSWFRRV